MVCGLRASDMGQEHNSQGAGATIGFGDQGSMDRYAESILRPRFVQATPGLEAGSAAAPVPNVSFPASHGGLPTPTPVASTKTIVSALPPKKREAETNASDKDKLFKTDNVPLADPSSGLSSGSSGVEQTALLKTVREPMGNHNALAAQQQNMFELLLNAAGPNLSSVSRNLIAGQQPVVTISKPSAGGDAFNVEIPAPAGEDRAPRQDGQIELTKAAALLR